METTNLTDIEIIEKIKKYSFDCDMMYKLITTGDEDQAADKFNMIATATKLVSLGCYDIEAINQALYEALFNE